jgi:hypothetical protein
MSFVRYPPCAEVLWTGGRGRTLTPDTAPSRAVLSRPRLAVGNCAVVPFDDSKLSLDIVPLTLTDFHDFLASGRRRLPDMPRLLRQLLVECRAKANQDAPTWKRSIRSLVHRLTT